MDQASSRAREKHINVRRGVKTLAVVVVGGLLAMTLPATAQAAGPVSQAEGRLLTVSLLGVDSAPILALNGAKAANPGGPATSDVALDATALDAITAQANGIDLFGDGGLIQLGAVGQYAAANADGSSVGFSGAVSDAPGVVGVGTVTPGNFGTPSGPAQTPNSAAINVGTAQLLGGTNLVQLGVDIGALSANAKETAGGVQTGAYNLAGLNVTVGGTVLGATIDSLNVLLDPVVGAVNTAVGAGTVTNPLAGGQLTISLADLLAAAGVANVNAIPQGTNLLTYLPVAVTAKLTTTVNTLLANLQTEVSDNGLLAVGILLGTANAAITPILAGLTAALNGPLGAAVNAVLQLNVNNKSTTAGAFTQNALTIGVGTAGSLASVRLANATVGPNAGPAAPAAAITGMIPTSGPVTGNTTVTITGTGFTGATGVTFDGVPATSYTVVNSTTITAVSPPHAAGPVNVVVAGVGGDSLTGAASVFTYVPLTITPNSGPTAGGTVVSITGTCFTGATGVTFDGIAGTNFSVVDDTHILVTAPAHAVAGAVDVVVLGLAACGGNMTAVDGFTYIAPGGPTAISLTPPSGPASGGTTVTITGTNLTGASGVTFDGIPGTGFTVVNGTTITVVSPPHAVGGVDVIVQSLLGPSGALPFAYLPLTVIGIDPGTGPEAGGTAVTITGTCFTGATGVLFGTKAATSFVVVNDTTIRAVSPAGVGTVDVTVIGNPLCGTATLTRAFQYTADGLAFTGAVVAPSLITAFLLLISGLAIFLIRRRRNGMTA
jgi:hypothetical protein